MIFTLLVKLVLLPLSIKQQKSSARTAVFQPKVAEIQKKYRNNPQKQQEELMKLQQMGYKPMAGCGTMLLSFLILFGVIDVVYKPLTHIVHMNSESIVAMAEESYDVEVASLFAQAISDSKQDIFSSNEQERERITAIVADAQQVVDYYNEYCLKEGAEPYELSIFETPTVTSANMINQTFKHAVIKAYSDDTSDKRKQKQISDTDLYALTDAEKAEMDALTTDEEKVEYRNNHSFSQYTISALNACSVHFGGYFSSSEGNGGFTASGAMQRELYALERFGSEVNGTKCSSAYSDSEIRPELKEELNRLYDNLNFLGIPLGRVPNMSFPIILIPLVSFAMSLLQTFISQRLMMQSNPDAAKAMGPMKMMLFIMPLISLWIAFTVPAGAGFYWAVSYFYGIIQSVVLNKLYNPVKLRAQAEAELNLKTKNKVVNVEPVKVVNDDGSEEMLTQKEINRRKLAAARKADAEKYGEEYNEDDDDNND
ncbi:MAG: YidC/Oxa1 family membrane protein insertase [Oscillospiraceae bacterium]|nr:YidC/Oxa1 family membrane protein insertase [Oscillospiraceae bacterium]